jgi:hypothetical protein
MKEKRQMATARKPVRKAAPKAKAAAEKPAAKKADCGCGCKPVKKAAAKKAPAKKAVPVKKKK